VPDFAQLASEDAEREAAGLAPRYAIPHEVRITPGEAGLWESIDADTMLWRFRTVAPGAYSLNLGFTRYFMPPGGQLTIYSADSGQVVRPFTAADNEDHGELWTPVVLTHDLIVEVTIPSDAMDQLELELTQIGYGYRGFGHAPQPRSGSCNIDVVCPQGNPWRNEIATVGVISTGGSLFCSGFMVNNTSDDRTPYFMTAGHCGIRSGNAPSLVVYWNYETTTCGGPRDGSLSDFQTGSFFRSTYSPSDFTLVELDDDPSPAWGVCFAGWDRGSGDAQSAVGIHHPSTDEKAISFENDPTQTTSLGGFTVPGDGTHVRVIDWDAGTTEPGSSGSPLFNQDYRVVGQLHGGAAACGNDLSDWYGRFSVSWNGGGTSSTRLRDWLDSANSGAQTVNTLCGGGGEPVADIDANGSDGPVTLLVGQSQTIDVSFDAGSRVGQPSEYYIVVVTPGAGIFWFTSGGWVQSGSPLSLYQGPMVSIARTTLIPNLVLPEGQWDWYLIVDNDTNGVVNGTWWDVVRVTVQSAGGSFDVTEQQLIDNTISGGCTGEMVATVNLGPGANDLTVDTTFPGDVDMSVEEPDGTCVWYGDPFPPNGGQHSGDVTGGGTETYTITNGPSGTYTVRAHTHSGPQTADVYIYGFNGSVNLTPKNSSAPEERSPIEEGK
jgi:hypothetical protein